MPRTKFLCDILDESFYQTSYRDRRNSSSNRELNRSLLKSSTLYVGNLSFYTREEQIWELFSRAGEVRRVIMGLHRLDKTPCGFCFVEYENREGAEMAMRYINHCRLDDRIIRTDWDAGFVEGRQFGRGRSGGQVCYQGAYSHGRGDIPKAIPFVRDEFRKDYDADRGGYGKIVQRMIHE